MKKLDKYLATPDQLAPLRESGRGKNVPLELLIFLGVFALATVAQLAVMFLLSIFVGVGMGASLALSGGTFYGIPEWVASALSLFSTAGMIAIVLVLLRFAFDRPLSTAGFRRPFLKEYLLGLLAGFGVFSLAILLCLATGAITFRGISPAFHPGLLVLFFLGFLIQGMSEELLCRGYFMLSVARKNSLAAGIIASSLLFSALHLANSGLTPLALLNLALFGLFAALYYLWRGDIWGVAAFHSMWNFAQGNLYGIQVSGGDMGPSLLASHAPKSAWLMNGGSFGLEGGLAVTIVLLLSIAFVTWRNCKRTAPSRAAEPEAPAEAEEAAQ